MFLEQATFYEAVEANGGSPQLAVHPTRDQCGRNRPDPYPAVNGTALEAEYVGDLNWS